MKELPPAPPPEGKEVLYERLHQDRKLVIDPDTGYVMRREAWERIDSTLDCLNELNRLAMGQEVEIEWSES